ncbi:hypothetical protein ACA910_013192 [Epithemia clementina (nom. ined.)]
MPVVAAAAAFASPPTASATCLKCTVFKTTVASRRLGRRFNPHDEAFGWRRLDFYQSFKPMAQNSANNEDNQEQLPPVVPLSLLESKNDDRDNDDDDKDLNDNNNKNNNNHNSDELSYNAIPLFTGSLVLLLNIVVTGYFIYAGTTGMDPLTGELMPRAAAGL